MWENVSTRKYILFCKKNYIGKIYRSFVKKNLIQVARPELKILNNLLQMAAFLILRFSTAEEIRNITTAYSLTKWTFYDT